VRGLHLRGIAGVECPSGGGGDERGSGRVALQFSGNDRRAYGLAAIDGAGRLSRAPAVSAMRMQRWSGLPCPGWSLRRLSRAGQGLWKSSGPLCFRKCSGYRRKSRMRAGAATGQDRSSLIYRTNPPQAASPLPSGRGLCLKRRGTAALLPSHRSVAQLVERRSPKPEVVGSSPTTPASKIKDLAGID
jgi:hypothetical protein